MQTSFTPFVQAHMVGCGLSLVLFLICYVCYGMNKNKGGTFFHILLRVMYVIIVCTGLSLLIAYFRSSLWYQIKSLLGILTVVIMEITLIRTKKGSKMTAYFASSLILFVVVLLFGYHFFI